MENTTMDTSNLGDLASFTISGAVYVNRETKEGVVIGQTKNGREFARFGVVVSKAKRNAYGNMITGTETYFVVAFDPPVVEAAKTLNPRQHVFVGGEVQNKWDAEKKRADFSFIVRSITATPIPDVPTNPEPPMPPITAQQADEDNVHRQAKPRYGITRRKQD